MEARPHPIAFPHLRRGGRWLSALALVLLPLLILPASGALGFGGRASRATTESRAKERDTETLPEAGAVLGASDLPEVVLTLPEWAVPFRSFMFQATSSDMRVVRSADIRPRALGRDQLAVRIQPSGVGRSRIRITLREGNLVRRFAVHLAVSDPGRANGIWHTGASDGSAAVALDSHWMLVGDDEDQTLRLYSREHPGAPAAAFPMDANLGLTEFHHNGQPKEIDIEAAVRIGDRVCWIGSESHDRSGQPALNRGRAFVTELSGEGDKTQLRFVGRYDHLQEDLIRWDTENLHGLGTNHLGLAGSAAPGVDAKEASGRGFVIEGACVAPGDGDVVWLGFRAPLVPPDARWRALLVPVTNFMALAVSGGPVGSARFGAPVELDLGGRGIRDLFATSNQVLVVAGPPGHPSAALPRDFRLYTWDGVPDHAPERRAADLTGLNPEAIVSVDSAPWSAETWVELVSDNGTTELYGDGEPAKSIRNPAWKKFRSDRVRLGAVDP